MTQPHYKPNILAALLIGLVFGTTTTSCVDDSDSGDTPNTVAVTNTLPEGIEPAEITSSQLDCREINSGRTYNLTFTQKLPDRLELPTGVYDFEGLATANVIGTDGTYSEQTLRTASSSVTISGSAQITFDWFLSNPESTLILSEIYATGSPNATATGGLRDSYVRIYNNSDQTIYADGLALVESAFVNSRVNTYEILTPENDTEKNFTAATIWVIPGGGTEHPILPGKSIKLVDQAIDWSAQVPGALNHTDADFEWWDDNAQDTDNPSVPNLRKWYCYSNSIWMMSNQANRSYALVRFPEGITAESYLAAYHGGYDYISAIGTQMHNDRAYLVPNAWIIDGVNLGNRETYVRGALGRQIDLGYAAISDINADPDRFGKIFARREAATLTGGRVILQDSDNSSADFTIVKADKER